MGLPAHRIEGPRSVGPIPRNELTGSGLGRNLQFWHQDSSGISGAAEESDGFGSALVAIPTVKRTVYLPLALGNP